MEKYFVKPDMQNNDVIIPESIQFLNPYQLKVKNIFRTGNGIMELYGYKKKWIWRQILQY